MKVVVLTGDELRHRYFKMRISQDKRFEVLASFCESDEKSMLNIVKSNPKYSEIERLHFYSRKIFENDYFGLALSYMNDSSKSFYLKKGDINNLDIVNQIKSHKPDILVCYGSSLIKSNLLDHYKNKFLNVHLGLSPYYRGSGSNIWPLINNELDMVGATFMKIDEGIDTGEIIHQIRCDYHLGDGPHSIGNRFITKMTDVYANIIANFKVLTSEKQPTEKGKLYLRKDFDAEACKKLYENFSSGIVNNFLKKMSKMHFKYIVENKGLENK